MKGFRIDEIDIKDFKNLKTVELTIDGRSFFISGKNGRGKSSLIQALQIPFDAGMLPVEPIAIGKEKASINIRVSGLDEQDAQREYRLEVSFTPSAKRGNIKIFNDKDEEVSKTRKFVDNIFNAISFDILSFLKMKPAAQVEQLRSLLPKQFLDEIDKLDEQREEKFKSRAYKNTRYKELEGSLKTHGYTDEEVKKYLKPMDVEALDADIKKIRDGQEKYDKVQRGVEERNNRVFDIEQTINKKLLEIELLKSEIAKQEELKASLSNEIKEGNKWLAEKVRPDDTELTERMSEAAKHNEHHHTLLKYKEKMKELSTAKEESETLSREIKDIDAKKVKLFSSQDVPVQGLTFTQDAVLFEGLPLDENQVERSRLIKVGAEIAMALNKRLRVIFIQDASLLDKDSIKYLQELCVEKGYQLIMEIVNDNETFEIEFMEKDVK